MIRVSVWTAVFLVLLRLAIGWHFLFEGLHKVHSTYTDRPFSSAGFFREAEGPLGSWMRKHVVGDADAEALARLTLLPERPDAQPHDRFPPALARDWQAYYDRFVQHYPLAEDQKRDAGGRLQQAKSNTALWLMGLRKEPKEAGEKDEPEQTGLKIKISYQGTTVEVWRTIPQLVQEYRDLLGQMREQYDRKLPLFGKDVEKARLRELKARVHELRTLLLFRLDRQTNEMKKLLAAVMALNLKDGSLPLAPPETSSIEPILLARLTPAEPLFGVNDRNVDWAKVMPGDLNRQWNEFFRQFSSRYRLSEEQKATAEALLAQAKERTARLLTDAGEVKSGLPQRVADYKSKYLQWQAAAANPQAASALKADLDKMTEGLQKELDQQTINMKQSLAGVLDENQREGFAPPPDEKRTGWIFRDWFKMSGVERLDALTRWGLVVMGACLMFGFLTRLNCLAAAGFLALTYLAMPALASLPVSPMNEGNYFIVNKNVVEMVALLALATTASGQWFGVDRLLCATWRMIRGPKKPAEEV